MLDELPMSPSEAPLTDRAIRLIAEGRQRFRSVDCFDFVPSDYELVWRYLAALPRGTFCEWGSGFGIVTGLAEILGFRAVGIELDERLVQASRELFADLNLISPIQQGDYLLSNEQADTYFVYCWPGRMAATEEHFERIAPPPSKLLICHGQSDVRCKVRV